MYTSYVYILCVSRLGETGGSALIKEIRPLGGRARIGADMGPVYGIRVYGIRVYGIR